MCSTPFKHFCSTFTWFSALFCLWNLSSMGYQCSLSSSFSIWVSLSLSKTHWQTGEHVQDIKLYFSPSFHCLDSISYFKLKFFKWCCLVKFYLGKIGFKRILNVRRSLIMSFHYQSYGLPTQTPIALSALRPASRPTISHILKISLV